MKKLLLLAMAVIAGASQSFAAGESLTTATYGNATGTTRTMTIALNRAASTEYVAFQAELTLPANTTVKGVKAKSPLENDGKVTIGGTEHSTTFEVPFHQNGTKCTILGYNLGNAAMGGATGDILLTVELESTEAAAFNAEGNTVATGNIIFVKKDGTTLAEVNVDNATTDSRLWGDVVKNGSVDATDYQAVANIITKIGNGSTAVDTFAADINQADGIDATDYQAIANIITGNK